MPLVRFARIIEFVFTINIIPIRVKAVCLALLIVVLAGCQSAEEKSTNISEQELSGLDEELSDQAGTDPFQHYIDDSQAKQKAGGGSYQHYVAHDLDVDGDGEREQLVLMANVEKDGQGRAMWEHGHSWQVYLDYGQEIRHLYLYHVPAGNLKVAVEKGSSPIIYITHQSPYNETILAYDLGQKRVDTVYSIPPEIKTLSLE